MTLQRPPAGCIVKVSPPSWLGFPTAGRGRPAEGEAMLISIGRALLITTILAGCIATSLAISLSMAHAGLLGTCQDGTCELVAVIYVAPFLSIGLYVLALIGYSVM